MSRPVRGYERLHPGESKHHRSVDQSEEALRQTAQRIQAIFDNTSEGIFLHDLETRELVMANKSCLQMLGYTEEEFLQLGVADIHAEADLPFIYAQIEAFLSGGKPIRHDIRFRRKDGSILFADVRPDLVHLDGKRYVMVVMKDVTARQRAQEALRFTQFAVDHTADAAFWMTRDARFCYVNEAACRALGYSRDELLKMTVYDIDPTFTESRWAETWRKLRADKSIMLETLHRAKNGQVYPVEIRANYVEFAGQEFDCAFARDISERKRAEEALRESEERFRTAFERSPVPMALTAMDTTMLKVNSALCRMLGHSESELVGRSYVEITHPDDRAANLVGSRQLAGGEISVFRMEKRYIRKDGTVVWADMNTAAVPGADGRPRYCVTHIQDITERKLAEEALRQSEERHRFLVESVNDWIWEVDANGVYTYASPQCREMLGYKPEEIVGKTPFDLMPPEEAERLREIFRSFADQAKPFHRLENVNRRKDGRLVVLETNGAPVLDVQGKLAGYRGVDRDITERRQAEEALREKEHLLSESQRIGHIGTWSADPATGIATWTRETYRLFGVSPATFVPTAEAMLRLLHPDDRAAMQEWIRAALAGEHPDALEFRVVLRDGSIRILSGRGELIVGDNNQPLRLVGTAQDITEHKNAEAALEELGRRNAEALRVARMGHWEFDVATGMFVFNDQYYMLHGITTQAAGGYRMTADEFARRYVHPEDACLVQESIRKAVAVEDPDYQFQTEARILRADGQTRWVTVWFRIEKDAQGRTIKLHGVNQDITERRYAEEALRRLNDRLEQLVAVRTEDLTHTVARLQQLTWELSQAEDRERKRIADLLHDDVQQTLAAARFHLNLLSIETRSPPESREIICQVRKMLKDAIEKARSLSHELSPALYQVELTEILGWLGDHMHDKHGLAVHVKAHGQVDPCSESLKALLYKVTQELLFNVVKHAGVKEATVRVRRLGRCVYLSVMDRGAGFDPHGLEETTGFGLLSIRERVHLLGGRMKIKSAPGTGSRFLIIVPDEGPSPTAEIDRGQI